MPADSILLLSADFFLPMRQLGSYFPHRHERHGGQRKIFRLLDLPETGQEAAVKFPQRHDIVCSSLRFSYAPDREILCGMDLTMPQGSFTAVVGNPAAGNPRLPPSSWAGTGAMPARFPLPAVELGEIDSSCCKISPTSATNSYLFKGTARDNLLMGKPDASDERIMGGAGTGKFIRNF